jgi:hypothetical protein
MSDCNKVYLVTTGDYSDYHIEAAFSDRGLAMMFCRHRNGAFAHDGTNGLGEYTIKEMDLDVEQPTLPAGYDTYAVAITMDGNASDVKLGAFPYDQYTVTDENSGGGDFKRRLEFVRGSDRSNYGRWPTQSSVTMKNYMITYCIARDKKHAVKIANERRAMVVANNLFDSTMQQEFEHLSSLMGARYRVKEDVDDSALFDVDWPASKHEEA